MIEAMVACFLCSIISLLCALYYSNSVKVYSRAQKRLQALQLVRNNYESSWQRQAMPQSAHIDAYAIEYVPCTPVYHMNSPFPHQASTFAYGHIVISWQQEGSTERIRMPFGYLKGRG